MYVLRSTIAYFVVLTCFYNWTWLIERIILYCDLSHITLNGICRLRVCVCVFLLLLNEPSNYQEYVCIMHMEFLFCENSKTSLQLNGADHWLPLTVMPEKSRPRFTKTAMTLRSTHSYTIVTYESIQYYSLN